MAVLHRGHAYKVDLQTKDGEEQSYSSLLVEMQAILNDSETDVPSLGTLTTDDGNLWAEARKLAKTVPSNDALITMVESAAFVLCLDEASPATSLERCHAFLLGDPSNRWFDKSLQFVVCANSVSAFLAEHSMIDGSTPQQMHQWVSQAILSHQTPTVPALSPNIPHRRPQKYPFLPDPSTLSKVVRANEQFTSNIASIKFHPYTLISFPSSLFAAHKLPPKTGFQFLIQLAALFHFGTQYAAWETIGLRHFHRGLTDMVQIILPSLSLFLSSASSPNLSKADKRALVFAANFAYVALINRVTRGKGYGRHMAALVHAVRKDRGEEFGISGDEAEDVDDRLFG